MRRLLEDFDAVFDLTCPVGDTPLGGLLERTVSGLERTRQAWGTEGRREEVVSESERFVSFYYRPHLFSGMETKLRLAHGLQYRLLPRELPPEPPCRSPRYWNPIATSAATSSAGSCFATTSC